MFMFVKSVIRICCIGDSYITVADWVVKTRNIWWKDPILCNNKPHYYWLQHHRMLRNCGSFSTGCGKTPKLYHLMLRVFATCCVFLPPSVAGFFRMLRIYTTSSSY
ncbi:uncharacterized protein EV154DRAFT_485368 [Mucor mucedo]|uniref:uncharacterized protein n=1 Tax=Mucor mucedo TaxID=29922 RepID=UPI00221EAF32|nr:uncharacterized protein EV154DRAFT_485368 [Mucor mucedo]KAI7884751.1 hypothetical protein EV154DRAFT_485368 [Mucor mucedo]